MRLGRALVLLCALGLGVQAVGQTGGQPFSRDLSAEPGLAELAQHGLAGDPLSLEAASVDPFDQAGLDMAELDAAELDEGEFYDPTGAPPDAPFDEAFDAPGAAIPAEAPMIPAGTLADMQADLRAVAADLQALRAQLLASGAAGFAAAGGDSALDRMDAIEAQISAMTDRTEQLENRLRRVVSEGTLRIGDIEFRLCELDPHCDLAALMTAEIGAQGGPMPGGMQGPSAPLQPGQVSDVTQATLPPPPQAGPQTAPASADEQRAFAAAQQAVAEGDRAAALSILDRLIGVRSGGPLTAPAMLLRGDVLHDQGDEAEAAASWLEAFAADPEGQTAPPALISLARFMAESGAPADACPYLAALTTRFPDAPQVAEAADMIAQADCPDEGLDG
ncbi:MAG: tol-pal system protein [Paracoccus sp. (in: a-proteobacteria)]|nr:tol-pal system protein [Paracoccus sp. (in: a-proteobacteria)]